MTPEFLTLPDRRLAYQRLAWGTPTASGVVFMGGYASDMTGTKASFLAEKCAKAGFSFLRFDYQGHGQSSGDFRDGTIGAWFEDACEAVGQLTEGPQIIVGSSMGGWLGLMLAVKRPERVEGLYRHRRRAGFYRRFDVGHNFRPNSAQSCNATAIDL